MELFNHFTVLKRVGILLIGESFELSIFYLIWLSKKNTEISLCCFITGESKIIFRRY